MRVELTRPRLRLNEQTDRSRGGDKVKVVLENERHHSITAGWDRTRAEPAEMVVVESRPMGEQRAQRADQTACPLLPYCGRHLKVASISDDWPTSQERV